MHAQPAKAFLLAASYVVMSLCMLSPLIYMIRRYPVNEVGATQAGRTCLYPRNHTGLNLNSKYHSLSGQLFRNQSILIAVLLRSLFSAVSPYRDHLTRIILRRDTVLLRVHLQARQHPFASTYTSILALERRSICSRVQRSLKPSYFPIT